MDGHSQARLKGNIMSISSFSFCSVKPICKKQFSVVIAYPKLQFCFQSVKSIDWRQYAHVTWSYKTILYHRHSLPSTVQIVVLSIPFFENTAWLWLVEWTGWVSTPAPPRSPAGVSSPTHCDHLLVHITNIAVATITAVIDITTHHHLKNCDHLVVHFTTIVVATIAAVIDITSHHHLKNCDHLLLHVTDLELALLA